MTDTQTGATHPEEHRPTDTSEVTFYLAPSTDTLPFRWVACITTPNGSWQSGHEPNPTQELELLTVELPERMSRHLLDYARRRIGPNATEQQIDHWCHTFAHEVGATALDVTDAVGGAQGLADAKARLLFLHGGTISPSELAVEEHAVVGDADPESPYKGPSHSMVGIGRSKSDDADPTWAVQVDKKNGDLYVGNPADYIADVKKSRSGVRPTTQPTLYVQRTPPKRPAQDRNV